jgi:hypothetical protein
MSWILRAKYSATPPAMKAEFLAAIMSATFLFGAAATVPGFAREFGSGFTSPTGIGVRVRKDHNLDVAKPWIGSFGDGSAGIREKPHTSGIFKQKRAIISAKLPGVTAQRRNFHDRRNIGGARYGGIKQNQHNGFHKLTDSILCCVAIGIIQSHRHAKEVKCTSPDA